MDTVLYAMLKNKIIESTYDDTEIRQKLLKVIEDVNVINGNGEGSINKTIADEIAKVIADAPESFNTLKELSDWINLHSEDAADMNSRIMQNTNNIANKLDKNQGVNNSGKIAGINESGDIVPMFPMGVEYNEDTNCLEFGADKKLNLNAGIQLDDTLSKKGYAADAGVTGKAVDELKSDLQSVLHNEYAYGYIQNKYNPDNNQSGVIYSNTVGNKLTIDANDNLSWQKIHVAETMSFNHVRAYALTDRDDIVVKQREFIDQNQAYTIDVSQYPDAYYLYVSCYNVDVGKVQVEYGNTLGEYAPHGVSALKIGSSEIMPVPYIDSDLTDATRAANAKSVGDKININAYKNVEDYQRIVDGEAETSLIDSMMTALSYVERRSSRTTKTININTVGGHREILRLHKRQGTDYQALETDVFLPDAADDFSDVRITDQNGNALPYDVLYSGDIDVIPDKNLPINPSGKIFQNSNGDWITYMPNYGISSSADHGKTWQKIGSLPTESSIVCFVTSDDVIFFSIKGVLKRSAPPYTSYETVLDISDRTNAYILSTNMVEYSTGVLFVAAYQGARNIEIYKSVDNGLTWAMSYSDPSGKYQHVHAMYIDRTQTPNAIYAGCDGGGGVLKSVDGGATWVDLRELHPSMPQSTDYGVIYADSDYRFLGGETAIVGGSSILRTSDDANFEEILHIGNSVYSIAKNGNKLYGGLACSKAYRQGGIIMSEDGGATWQNIYTTYHYQSDSASDGGRYVDVLDGQVVVGMQDAEGIRPSVRVYPSGHYAEILVDIPIGTTSIIVSDGYACGKRAKMYNDYSLGLPEMVSFNFNENTDVVKESISGKVYGGQYTFVDGGRHIGNTYPYIHKPSDAKMISLGDDFDGFLVDGLSFADVAGMTISFWGICGAWETVVISSPTKTKKLSVLNHALAFLGNNVDGNFNYPITGDSINHYVISIDFTNNIVKGYKNGVLRSDRTGNSDVATWINNMKTATSVLFFPSKAIVQHFQLFNGIATDDDVKRMYLAGINT